jgi:hypothetical protein
MKDTTMTIRIEDDLRARLNEAAALAHRPAAQIIRDLIRDFVAAAPRPALSEADLMQRRDAVDFARGCVELEGGYTCHEFNELMEQFARGEIEMEVIHKFNELHPENLPVENPFKK